MSHLILLDIGATHVTATYRFVPSIWSRARLWAEAHLATRGTKAQAVPADLDQAATLPLQSQTGCHTEVAYATDFPSDSEIASACLQTIEGLQSQVSGSIKGSSVEVRLSMRWVLMQVTRVDLKGQTDQRIQQMATALLQDLPNMKTDEQIIRWRIQPDRQHLCVMGIPTGLMGSLQSLCESRGMRLTSFLPAVVEVLEEAQSNKANSSTTQTLVWTERALGGGRTPHVGFIRVHQGSGIHAWQAHAPERTTPDEDESLLQALLLRFQLACGAQAGETAIRHLWPLPPSSLVPLSSASVPVADLARPLSESTA